MGSACVSANDNHNNSRKDRKSKILEEIKINGQLLVNRQEGTPLEKYQVLQPLGEGSYGKVFLVRHKETNAERAMKEIKKTMKANQTNDQDILNEVEILKKLDHPNILKIFEFFCMTDRYFLITDYCTEGELFTKITKYAPFDEKVASHLMHQIFSAVLYCHNNNIIHRDLKPENILVSHQDKDGNYHIKIIDFGTAKIFKNNEIEKKIIGSSYYIAPEVLSQNYTQMADLWSCGVILYILLSGQAPFNGSSDKEIMARIRIGKYDIQSNDWKSISNDAKNLIQMLLNQKPDERPSAKEALNHPFITKYHKNISTIPKDKLVSYVNNLKHYRPEFFLQQAALALIVRNIPSTEDMIDLTVLFQNFDENGDGKITKEELAKGFKKLVENDKTAKSVVEEIFQIVDSDSSGFIDYQEFIRACIDKKKILTQPNLRFAFNYFDKDGSGEITTQELKEVFYQNEQKCDEAVLRDLVEEIDSNKDGQISFEEFINMMVKIFDIEIHPTNEFS